MREKKLQTTHQSPLKSLKLRAMYPPIVVQLHNAKMAQKTVTVNPTVTTLSTVKSKKDSSTELDTLIGVPTAPATENFQQTPSNRDGDKPLLGVTNAFFWRTRV